MHKLLFGSSNRCRGFIRRRNLESQGPDGPLANDVKNLIALTWPQEFNELPAGTKVTATVKRTIDARDYTSKPKDAELE